MKDVPRCLQSTSELFWPYDTTRQGVLSPANVVTVVKHLQRRARASFSPTELALFQRAASYQKGPEAGDDQSNDRPMTRWTTAPSTSLVWLRRGLLLAFTALATWLTVKLILAIATPSSLWEPVMIARPGPSATTETRTYDFSYNPFAVGDADTVEVPSIDPAGDAPETTLNLELKGLRSGENGTAFVQTPDGQDDNYYFGDEIMPNVILRGVFPNYVLIEVNGQTQRLTTADAKAARAAGPTPNQSATLQTLRSADAATLLSQVEIRPYLDMDLNRVGVTVSPRSSAIDLSTYGLRSDDIITRFAGQSLTNGFPDIAALRRSAGSGRPVDVDIIRDGQPMTITIGSSS